MARLTISFGHLAKPFKEQLADQGLGVSITNEDALKRLENFAACCRYMHLIGIVTDAERVRIEKRIFKRLQSVAEEMGR